jgi:hypothetical protein
MATVVADMSMSVGGFSADRNDDVGPLFDWYRAGPATTPSADERWSFHRDEASAAPAVYIPPMPHSSDFHPTFAIIDSIQDAIVAAA